MTLPWSRGGGASSQGDIGNSTFIFSGRDQKQKKTDFMILVLFFPDCYLDCLAPDNDDGLCNAHLLMSLVFIHSWL